MAGFYPDSPGPTATKSFTPLTGTSPGTSLNNSPLNSNYSGTPNLTNYTGNAPSLTSYPPSSPLAGGSSNTPANTPLTSYTYGNPAQLSSYTQQPGNVAQGSSVNGGVNSPSNSPAQGGQNTTGTGSGTPTSSAAPTNNWSTYDQYGNPGYGLTSMSGGTTSGIAQGQTQPTTVPTLQSFLQYQNSLNQSPFETPAAIANGNQVAAAGIDPGFLAQNPNFLTNTQDENALATYNGDYPGLAGSMPAGINANSLGNASMASFLAGGSNSKISPNVATPQYVAPGGQQIPFTGNPVIAAQNALPQGTPQAGALAGQPNNALATSAQPSAVQNNGQTALSQWLQSYLSGLPTNSTPQYNVQTTPLGYTQYAPPTQTQSAAPDQSTALLAFLLSGGYNGLNPTYQLNQQGLGGL